MDTNYAPFLAGFFLYSYEAKLMQNLVESGEKAVAKSFNSAYRYIIDVLSFDSPSF